MEIFKKMNIFKNSILKVLSRRAPVGRWNCCRIRVERGQFHVSLNNEYFEGIDFSKSEFWFWAHLYNFQDSLRIVLFPTIILDRSVSTDWIRFSGRRLPISRASRLNFIGQILIHHLSRAFATPAACKCEISIFWQATWWIIQHVISFKLLLSCVTCVVCTCVKWRVCQYSLKVQF